MTCLRDLCLGAAERYGQLAVEHKHIFSIHSLASLLLTPDVLVKCAVPVLFNAFHAPPHEFAWPFLAGQQPMAILSSL